jgi:NAD(P)-dependent dehydrogenase (short-subunit alcohol dehydrogenase family)
MNDRAPERRTVWITGAGKGIGRALALHMAREGWTVAVSARTRSDLESLKNTDVHLSEAIHPFPVDVTDRNAVRTCVQEIETSFGRIDVAILNAGTHRRMPADQFDSDAFAELINVNLMGAVHGIDAVLPSMIARQGGRIAVVASLAGYRGLPTAAAYGATKAALINMCEALHPDLRQYGIMLQLISPGFVETPLTAKNEFPMPFLIKAEAAAARIYKGLQGNRFEIAFPTRFVLLMKLLQRVPYGLYFAITRRML